MDVCGNLSLASVLCGQLGSHRVASSLLWSPAVVGGHLYSLMYGCLWSSVAVCVPPGLSVVICGHL